MSRGTGILSSSEPSGGAFIDTWAAFCARVGPNATRYAFVLLLLLFGSAKWTAGEAMAIQPLVSHSPFFGWLYGVLSVQGVSIFFGGFEIAAGVLIALRPWLPLLSGIGSSFCIVMFLTTLSFFFTTPGVTAANANGQFLLKDVVLLGASIWTAGEALQAARRRGARTA